MTAAAPASQNRQPGQQVVAVPWRQLVQVTARQHRTALMWAAVAAAVPAVALLATGVPLHELAARGGPGWFGESRASVDYGGVILQLLALLLQLVPLLAGMFLGAPLLPREIEHGTARLAWTQAASRPRWLLAQVLPVAGLLALAGLGLGAGLDWWLAPFPHLASAGSPASVGSTPWAPMLFNLSPPLLAGWAVFAFTLGVFLGAVSWRTLPAIAATLLCYGTILVEVAVSWRMHYIVPLRRAFAVHFISNENYDWSSYWGHQQPVTMSQRLGWPDGRLLSNYDLVRPAAWLRLHHIMMWITYQPASRFRTFQLIELGWLLAASALLVAAAVFLIRRRPA